MTSIVLHAILGITMNGVTTLTQKGQVAIPKPIRDHFGLKPFDKISFEVRKDKIIAKRVPTIEEMFGIFKTSKKLTKKEMKKAIQEAVLEKFRRKNKNLR